MSTRSFLAAAGVATVIAAMSPMSASAATASPAESETSIAASCDKGYFCGYNSSGSKILNTDANWGPSSKSGVISYKNNGYPAGGVVLLEWEGDHGGVCISPGQSGTFDVTHTVTRVTWWNEGECPR